MEQCINLNIHTVSDFLPAVLPALDATVFLLAWIMCLMSLYICIIFVCSFVKYVDRRPTLFCYWSYAANTAHFM